MMYLYTEIISFHSSNFEYIYIFTEEIREGKNILTSLTSV